MATMKSLKSLEKSKEAVLAIKEKLLPVLQQLADDKFGETTGQAQASVALSIGMMRYMAARIRGFDEGRKADDPLRKDLNNIKRVLAKTKKSKVVTATRKPKSETKSSPTKLINGPTKDCQKTGLVTGREKASHKKKRKTKSVANNEQNRLESPSKKSRKM